MNNRNLSVGLFVLAAVALGIVLTVWFTGQRGTESASRYHVFIESDVSGLTLGGPVFFMGVQVGAVSDLVIVPGNPARVRVEIRIRESAPVDTGTWATLAAQGITGVSVINLSAEPGDNAALRAEPGKPLPVIPYRDTGFSALLNSAPAVLEKIDSLLASANELFSPTNQAAITAVLTDIQALTGALAEKEDDIAALPGALDQTLADLQGVSERVEAILNEAGPGAVKAVENLEAATASLRDLGGRLDGWLIRHDADIEAFATDGLGQVPSLLGELRNAVREMDKLLEELRNQPSRALFKPPNDAVPIQE